MPEPSERLEEGKGGLLAVEGPEPLEFPPLIERPGPIVITALLLTGLFVGLSLTVARPWWEAVGVSTAELLRLGSIPFISVGFTYCHIWLALWLTFYPLEFWPHPCLQLPGTNVGLGWQGIVPFRAEAMARHALELMLTQLISVEEVFSRLDPTTVAALLSVELTELLPGLVERAGAKHLPQVWALLPEATKTEIALSAREQCPAGVTGIMKEMNSDIQRVFDIEELVVTLFTRNKQLLCDMFIQCGNQELRFLRNSGALWGGVFGLTQMVLWIFPATRQPEIVFPVFGLVVGGLTNWIALKLIFSPVEPLHLCCGCKLQGFFLQRQEEVSKVFGRIVATKVLSSANIIAAILQGPTGVAVAEIVSQHVNKAVDQIPGAALPLVRCCLGEQEYAAMKADVADELCNVLPKMLGRLEGYAQETWALEHTLHIKMAALPPGKFERLLHPVFEPDEWKLILMGGLLGLAIGFVQAYGINT